jgi:hypothetical protein
MSIYRKYDLILLLIPQNFLQQQYLFTKMWLDWDEHCTANGLLSIILRGLRMLYA